MKVFKLVLIAAALCLIVPFASAQKAETAKTGTKMAAHKSMKKATVKTVYACPGCEYANAKAGKCPKCGAKLLAVKANVSTKGGKTMAMLYACEACSQTSLKPAKCPKCGKAMTKENLEVMGGKKGK